MKSILFLLVICSLISPVVSAQRETAISDESKVPSYQLPDVLTKFNGGKVESANEWFKKQRPEILKLFINEVYGKIPGKLGISEVKVWETSDNAVNGLAVRKQLSLFFKRKNQNLEVNVLMYLPKTEQKVPVFLAYNFTGNHAVYNDPNIRLTESWVANNPSVGITNNQVTEQSRASASDRFPVDQHELLALIAPRPLYVASAEGDQWADPKGEFLSAKYASSVYQLLGLEGLPAKEMPEINHPVMGTIGYHIRSGKHDLTVYDWEQYIRFADKHFKGLKD